ncbi:hypothetical protein [Salarchaeum sp. JOR-1]|uniref:DUF7519 family protein n=1 Tax=Salarchaeum sp. JOR-1 TaxID=2599399 RepID=UPI001198CBA1|nr:hypothetical protein [Salarchaeum sp. JOR-1]QDX39827.1 hypothetical protein FQU85_02525 [Salarchaeum sp. JOR-1]
MTEFEPTPPRNTATAATVALTVATLLVTSVSTGVAAVAAVGVLAFAYGAFSGSRFPVTAGAAVVFLAALLAAIAVRTAVFAPLAAAALTVAAWDLAEHGIGLGEHVGADARTRNAELVHAALTVGVAVLAVTAGYAVYLVGADGRPVAAVVLLAAGALALFGALR